MATPYEYDNLPDEMQQDAMPHHLLDDAHAALNEALNSIDLRGAEAHIAYISDERGYIRTRPFGDPNNNYDSEDDVVIRITARIPNPARTNVRLNMPFNALREKLEDHHRAEEARNAEAELRQAELEAEQAEQMARQKRQKLAELRNKQA